MDIEQLKSLAETLKSFGELDLNPGPEFEVDGLTPFIAVKPGTQSDVAGALRAGAEAGAAVIPRGAGTQMSLGMPPERYDVALDLSKLGSVFEHESADLTVTVDAAHGWQAMQDALAQHGQWVPLDPVLAEGATVGGVLATNASGPARIRYGTARDLVIGMTVALSSGEIVKSGGRVVKNVAGYDMAKLHIGALGTLGVILQASFKVSPLAGSRPYAGASGDMAGVLRLAGEVQAARLPLLGLEVTKSKGTPWTLVVQFGGGTSAVERAVSEFQSLAAATKAKVMPIDQLLRLPGHPAVMVRASVIPTKLARLTEALEGAGAWLSTDPAAGVLRAAWEAVPEAKVVTELRRQAVAAGGALVLEAAPGDLKRAVGVWGEPRGDFSLMQRLKQQFDPVRVLNPGRFIGGI